MDEWKEARKVWSTVSSAAYLFRHSAPPPSPLIRLILLSSPPPYMPASIIDPPPRSFQLYYHRALLSPPHPQHGFRSVIIFFFSFFFLLFSSLVLLRLVSPTASATVPDNEVEEAASECGSDIVLPLDVADDAQIDSVFAELGKRWDGLDVLVRYETHDIR